MRETRKTKNQGMNWITPKKRLAIYLRDGLACSYCGQGIEQDIKLTLDHLVPYCKGGSNEATNLVTCCHTCNSARGNRSWRGFAAKVAGYINHGVTAEQIAAHIQRTRKRTLDTDTATEIIDRRGNFSSALAEAAKRTSK